MPTTRFVAELISIKLRKIKVGTRAARLVRAIAPCCRETKLDSSFNHRADVSIVSQPLSFLKIGKPVRAFAVAWVDFVASVPAGPLTNQI